MFKSDPDSDSTLERHHIVNWRVNDYNSLNFAQSPKFSVAKNDFCICIYTAAPEKMKCIGLYLYPSNLFSGNYTIGIKKIDGTTFRCFKQDKTVINPASFIREKEILEDKRVLHSDGSFTVFCQLSLDVDTENDEVNESLSFENVANFICTFKNLLNSGRYSDVTIKVQDREFHAHKVILSARSKVFDSMFQHNMMENQSGQVSITDCDAEEFNDFLTFLYTADSEVISSENALKLFVIADKYSLDDLKKECLGFMINNVTADNIFFTLDVATLYKENLLLKRAKEIFVKNWRSIVKNKNWKEFFMENMLLANELFAELANANTERDNDGVE